MDKSWNPWKVTSIGMSHVMATALVTGLVVANWSGSSRDSEQRVAVPAGTRPAQSARTKPSATQAVQAVPAVPTQEGVDACNRYATDQVGEPDETTRGVKDRATGAVVGAGDGAR